MKKVNPRNRPRSEADVKRAEKVAVDKAVHVASAIFLTVLLDKFGGEEWIPDIWREVNKLSEEISERRVSVNDLTTVLREEYGIDL